MRTKIQFVEPGVDPTEEEYVPDGPSCSGCLTLGVALFAVVAIGLFLVSVMRSQQAQKAATPTEHVLPTEAPTQMNTPKPTSTGTVTPQPPTATPKPSITPTFIPPPTNQKQQQRVITATSFVTPPSVMTATEWRDARAFFTPTPLTPRQKRKLYIAAATATARAIQRRPTETPAG